MMAGRPSSVDTNIAVFFFADGVLQPAFSQQGLLNFRVDSVAMGWCIADKYSTCVEWVESFICSVCAASINDLWLPIMILKLDPVQGEYAIVRLPPDSKHPDWASGEIVSITWTPDQCSLICDASLVPESVESDPGWRCLKVHGKLGFSAVGTVDSIAQPLRAARISIFVVSTYDTDYVFIHSKHFDEACRVLKAAGHIL